MRYFSIPVLILSMRNKVIKTITVELYQRAISCFIIGEASVTYPEMSLFVHFKATLILAVVNLLAHNIWLCYCMQVNSYG